MEKTYGLKSWFFLSEAADRISSAIGERVTKYDLVQFVLDGHLNLSWLARHVYARRVAPFTFLFGKGYSPDWIIDKNGKHSGPVWGIESLTSIENEGDIQPAAVLDGPYRLEVDLCGALRDRLVGYLEDLQTFLPSSKQLHSLDGFFLSDSEGQLWQVLDFSRDTCWQPT